MKRILYLFSFAAALAAFAAPRAGADGQFEVEDGFTSLFDGKDLTGWEYKGSKEDLDGKTATADDRFAVDNGAIVARAKDKNGQGGGKDLYTIKKFAKAFHLKLEFRAEEKAASGVYVRGTLLKVNDFIRRNEQKQLKKFAKDDWNLLEIVVKNNVLVTAVNDRPLAETDTFEMSYKDGKATATLNGKAIDPKKVSVRYTSVAVCTVNGEPLETLTVPATGAVGLRAEDGKLEFRRIRIKEQP